MVSMVPSIPKPNCRLAVSSTGAFPQDARETQPRRKHQAPHSSVKRGPYNLNGIGLGRARAATCKDHDTLISQAPRASCRRFVKWGRDVCQAPTQLLVFCVLTNQHFHRDHVVNRHCLGHLQDITTPIKLSAPSTGVKRLPLS